MLAERFPIVQWSAEDASRSELDFLAHIVEAVIQAGARVINIPDTVAMQLQQNTEIFSVTCMKMFLLLIK